jgi:hypothetical protein
MEAINMEDFVYRWISLIGFFVILCIAWITGTKTKINLKTILWKYHFGFDYRRLNILAPLDQEYIPMAK